MHRLVIAAAAGLLAVSASVEEIRLKYIGRYVRQGGGPDHLMGVESIADHYALVSSNLALTLVDLDTLPVGGTQQYAARLTGLDAFATYTRPDGYCYVHLRQGGLAVVRVEVNPPSLTLVRQIAEPGVFYEKMQLVGDRLYVAAHAYGIRIFELTDPAQPSLLGALTTGLHDAFAIAVASQTAYVADGAGGLKIVDITNPAAPVLVTGEDPLSAAGTAEDVMVIGEHVYVASGGAGVAVYPRGVLTPRRLFDTPICAKHLARVGDYLAVADLGGLQVFHIETDGSLTFAAREQAMRRTSPGGGLSLRLWHGVSAWGNGRVLAANWDAVDVYQLADPATFTQADVTATVQRVRFEPAGGSTTVRLSNDGATPLNIANIGVNAATFTVQPTQGLVHPGESLDLHITYAGGQPGSAVVRVQSNDPDENPLPIQVFGDTTYLDPGEPAVPFVLESWTYDHPTQQFAYHPFDLAAQTGKVIYLQIYASW
jgi:hypothetical protein